MDASISGAEENNGATNISASRSSSETSPIKIDSICIDLSHAVINETSTAKSCNHFSIRGYVAEIRKKNGKICCPFSVGENAENQTSIVLPPLHVRKFRWWSCQNCLKDMGVKGNSKENGIMVLNGTCSTNIPFCGGMGMLLSDNGWRPDVVEGRKATSNQLTNEVLDHKNSFEGDDVDKKLLEPTHGAREFNPCMLQKVGADGTATKTRCNGFVNLCNCGSHEVAHTGFAISNVRGMIRSSGEICHSERSISADDQHRQVANFSDKTFDHIKDWRRKHSSMEINECDFQLPEIESDGIFLVGNNEHCSGSDSSHRKKTQKVRLLTDLLSSSNDMSIDNIKIKEASSKEMASASLRMGSPSVSVRNVATGCEHQNRKRKGSKDEDWRPPQISSQKNVKEKVRFLKGHPELALVNTVIKGEFPKNVRKKVRFFKGDLESSPINNAIAGSELICFSTGRKSQNIEQTINANSIQRNKKARRNQAVDRCSSLLPPQDVVLPRDGHGRTGGAANGNMFVSTHGVFNSGETSCSAGIQLPAQSSKRNVTMMGPKGFPCLPAEDAPYRKEGLHISVQDWLAAQGNDKYRHSQVEDGIDVLLPWQQHQIMMKTTGDKCLGYFSVPLTSAPDASIRKQESGDLNVMNIMNGMSFSGGNQNCTSRGGLALPLMQQKGSSGNHRNERAVGVQVRIDDTKSNQRAGKLLEQGTHDDIPMEIVELMAKHQYERCVPDARENYCLSEAANSRRDTRGIIDFSGVHRNGELRLLPDGNPHLRIIHPSNTTNGITTTDKTPQVIKQKLVSLFSHDGKHFDVGQLKEAQASTAVIPFLQHQEIQPTGVGFSTSVGFYGDNPQICRFNGNTVGGKLYTSSPAQNSPIRPTNTDMVSQCRAAILKGNLNGHHDLGILDSNAPNSKKLKRNLSFENYNREHAEYTFSSKCKAVELHPEPVNSSDAYPSETMSAMHLLSLMHAGLQGHTAFNINGNQKFLKKASFPDDHYSKEFSGLGNGEYKAVETSRNPSSEFYNGNYLREKSSGCLPTIPTAGSFPSFLNDKTFEEGTGLEAQISTVSNSDGARGSAPKGKRGRPKKAVSTSITCGFTNSSPKKKRGRPRKSVPTTWGLGPNRKSVPGCELQKRSLGASDSVVFQPMQSVPETGICSVNRNPADFSLPVAGNVYMIRAKDLKLFRRKTAPSKNRSGLLNF